MKTYGDLEAWYYARPLEKRRREEFIPADDFAELLEFATSQGHMAPRPGRPLLVLGTYWYEQVALTEVENARIRSADLAREHRWYDR